MITDTAPAFREIPLLMVPTYNERDNVVTLCERFADLRVPLDILFIDDNSPDGTGAVLDELATRSSAMTVLHRQGKLGIGTAHQAGIAWAYSHGYRVLITMDADFSHDPAYVPAFLAAAGDVDVVVGSRHLQSNSLREWNLVRKVAHEGRVPAHAPASRHAIRRNRRVPALSSRSHPAGTVRVGGVAGVLVLF